MTYATNIGWLLTEGILMVVVCLAAFRWRHKFGLGPLYVMVGGFQHMQTNLAAAMYVEIAPGMLVSPGSAVLFVASLFVVLLIYLKEDAVEARSFIYGVVATNLALAVIGFVIYAQANYGEAHVFSDGYIELLVSSVRIFTAGTTALLIDVLLIIVLFEFVSKYTRSLFARINVSLIAVVIVDCFVFSTAAFVGTENYTSILVASLIGKTGMALFYGAALYGYLQYFPAAETHDPYAVRDIFAHLTYRQRFDELSEKAQRDHLSGLYNRGHFDRTLARSLEDLGHVALVLIDLDDFKVVNDRHGHTSGDLVIKTLARAMSESFRDGDVPCRYGGDEFAVILPGVERDAATAASARLRAKFTELAADSEEPVFASGPVGLSIGIAAKPGDGQTALALIDAADRALPGERRQTPPHFVSLVSILDNTSITERTVDLDKGTDLLTAIVRLWDHEPDLPALRRAARLYLDPTPGQLEDTARWLHIRDELKASGFNADERLRVILYIVGIGIDEVLEPDPPVLLDALSQVDEEMLGHVATALGQAEELTYSQNELAGMVVVTLARRSQLTVIFDSLIDFEYLDWMSGREVVAGLPANRAEAVLDSLLTDSMSPSDIKNALLFVDLMTEDQRATLKRQIGAIRKDKSDQKRAKKVAGELQKQFKAGFAPPTDQVIGGDGLTQASRDALEYWIEELAATKIKKGLGPLAESRSHVAIEVDAPELRTLATWSSCSRERKEEVARAVEAVTGKFDLEFEGLETFDPGQPELEVAVFANRVMGMKLTLIPGGTYQRGFSEREQKLVEEVGGRKRGMENWEEEFQNLIDLASSMRPVAAVTVQPFLVFQEPTEAIDPAEATAFFQSMPFRLMTEAEHEWASRGGRASDLTWRGHEVADEQWLEEVMSAGSSLQNPFGLAMLGLYPEVLVDRWVDSYEKAPTDGSARTGKGPRVVRGGAAVVYPWQACGEWHLLTNAKRSSAKHWEFYWSIRPAIGVVVPAAHDHSPADSG